MNSLSGYAHKPSGRGLDDRAFTLPNETKIFYQFPDFEQPLVIAIIHNNQLKNPDQEKIYACLNDLLDSHKIGFGDAYYGSRLKIRMPFPLRIMSLDEEITAQQYIEKEIARKSKREEESILKLRQIFVKTFSASAIAQMRGLGIKDEIAAEILSDHAYRKIKKGHQFTECDLGTSTIRQLRDYGIKLAGNLKMQISGGKIIDIKTVAQRPKKRPDVIVIRNGHING